MRMGLVIGIAGLLALQTSLSGCSTVTDAAHSTTSALLSVVGLDSSGNDMAADDSAPVQTAQADQTAQAAAPAPAPVVPADSGWCDKVANRAKADAAGNGYGAATQERRYDIALHECMSLSAQQ